MSPHEETDLRNSSGTQLKETECLMVSKKMWYVTVEGSLPVGGQVDELDEDVVREKPPAYWSGRFFTGLIRYLRAAKGGLMKLRAHLAQPDSLGIALLAAASSQLLCVQVELDGRGSLEVFPDAAIISVFEYKSSQSGALPAPVNCCPASTPVLPANRGGFLGGGQIFSKNFRTGIQWQGFVCTLCGPPGKAYDCSHTQAFTDRVINNLTPISLEGQVQHEKAASGASDT